MNAISMKAKPIPSLKDLFHAIRTVGYVVVSPYHNLPYSPVDKLVLLSNDVPAIVAIWNLTKVNKDGHYRTSVSLGNSTFLHVYEKGKNVFPEPFESQLLQRAAVFNDAVRVPSHDDYILMRLYWEIFYEGMWKDQPFDRRRMIDYVQARTGSGMRPKYSPLKELYKSA